MAKSFLKPIKMKTIEKFLYHNKIHNLKTINFKHKFHRNKILLNSLITTNINQISKTNKFHKLSKIILFKNKIKLSTMKNIKIKSNTLMSLYNRLFTKILITKSHKNNSILILIISRTLFQKKIKLSMMNNIL